MKTIASHILSDIQFCPPIASSDFYELILRFALNLGILLIISRGIFFTWNRKPEHMFAQLISGTIVFIICSLLRWVQLELGLVLGLFAIFSIIRFRTINVGVKEMSYLFMTVGISAVNALMTQNECIGWIVFANLIVMIIAYVIEKVYYSNRLSRRTITYNNTDLIKPSKHALLMKDLQEMTELNIIRFEIGKVDYIKNNAQIKIYFKDTQHTNMNEEGSDGDDD